MKKTITGFTSGTTPSGAFKWHAALLHCGHQWFSGNIHLPILAVGVGDTVECTTCDDWAKQEQWLVDLDYSIVHHSRFDPRFGGVYRFYRLDKDSPSGFMIVGYVHVSPRIDEILKTKTNCGPLSPTETA